MKWPAPTTWSPIGIDVSGRLVNVVQLVRGKAGFRLEAALSMPRADVDVPVHADEMRQVADVLDRQGFRGRSVVVAVPTDNVLTEVLSAPNGEAVDADMVRDQLTRTHRFEPDTFECAYWSLPQGSRVAPETVMAVACPHEPADEILDAFEGGGLHVQGLDVQSWALSRACSSLLEETSGLSAVLNLDWGAANLVVLNQAVVAYGRLLSDSGLNRLHMHVLSELDADTTVSEYILREIGLTSDTGDLPIGQGALAGLQAHMLTYIQRLSAELKRSFAYIVQQYDQSVERLLLVGEGARIPGLAERLASELGVEVRPVAPRDVVRGSASLRDLCDQPTLTTALGLALYPTKGAA